MMQRNRHRRHVVSQIIRFIRRGVKAIAKTLIYLTVEFTIYVAIAGVAIALFWLGLPSYVALGLSIGLVILSLTISFLAYRQHRLITRRSVKTDASPTMKGDVKLADLIAQTLAEKAPQEWEEYQDWLHDILLDRRQRLDEGDPHWRVTLLTYWRLTRLCITVTLIKLRRLAIAARRLR
ncbi:MAG: hypothetical protein RID09_17995 [Coleofasciculus sp. G1-WW12-02]|uniref:hypothetical protein n=1 Tax=Coleofasciculus sp. G1-WW12-02 TaxID=3068483 RepID=UPI0032FFC744